MKKLCSIILSAAMAFISINAPQYSSNIVNADDTSNVYAWDGTVDTTWYNSNKTVMNINNPSELAGLASLVNNGNTMKGQTFILNNDFSLSGYQWTTIGIKSATPFLGIFDGNNHTISGLTITSTGDQANSLLDVGLFGSLQTTDTIIKNLNMKDVSIEIERNSGNGLAVGGIAGNGGTIINSQASGLINIDNNGSYINIGGIVGTGLNIEQCKSNVEIQTKGSLKNEFYIGGICGALYGEINECCNYGKIINTAESSDANVGGIVGSMIAVNKDTSINNSYNRADIESSSDSYGIVGKFKYNEDNNHDFEINNVYNTGKSSYGIYGKGAKSGKIEKTYFSSQCAAKGTDDETDSTIAKSSDDMKKGSFAVLLGGAFSYKNDSYPVLRWELNAETESSVWDGTYDTSWYDEEDTEFHLNTAQEFAGLCSLTNKSKKTFEGKFIYLENDIDMAGIPFPSFCISDTTSFKGTLNAKFHVISNFSLDTDLGYNRGAMINTLEGTVTNLKIENINISAKYTVAGGICRILNGGKIINCSVQGYIENLPDAAEQAASGGICGKAISGIIEGCVSKTKIKTIISRSNTGCSYVGGICGTCEKDTIIRNSYHCGEIDNLTYYLSNDLSKEIYTSNSYSGGIIGKVMDKLTIANVYNIGTLSGKSSIIGGIIGKCDEAELNFDKLYYLTSTATSGVGKGEEVAIAKSDANMKKDSFVESLGSDFIYKENSYPPLKWEVGYTEPETTTTTTETSTTMTTTTTTITTSSTTTTMPINSEFKLEVTSISINNGDQYTIPINRDDLVYKSSNPDVAVVSPKGVVTAIGTGEAVINIIDKDYNVIQLKVSVKSGGSSQNKYPLGDVNNDGQINAVDASSVLSYYAMISTNKDGGFDDNQMSAADVNHDGQINAVDASSILAYYAYASTTKEEIKSLEEFLKKH